jgi:RNA polymerase sigma-70 factor (ECF subfamily)
MDEARNPSQRPVDKQPAPDLESRVRAGDLLALAEFIELHKTQLMRAVERKVGSGLRRKLDLEDILQETSARAVRDLPNIKFGEQDPLGWLFQVMDRQIVDLHRYHFEAQKRNAGREISVDQPLGQQPGEARGFADLLVASLTTPSAAVSRDLRLARVYDALASLNQDMQNAIRWRYLDNLPSQQIAEKLGKSDAATRVLLSRAIRKLQTSLSKQ